MFEASDVFKSAYGGIHINQQGAAMKPERYTLGCLQPIGSFERDGGSD